MSIRQQTTHRILRTMDSGVTCYVRDEAGRSDLSVATCQVTLRPYGGQQILTKIDAASDANGKVTFTVPSSVFATVQTGYDYGFSRKSDNLARFDIVSAGQVIYQAILEIE